MSRKRLDGRLATNCDSCGADIPDAEFTGVQGLTELLGLAICSRCAEGGQDPVVALLGSGLLTPLGKLAVRDWLAMRAPEDVRDLFALLRDEPGAARRLAEGRAN